MSLHQALGLSLEQKEILLKLLALSEADESAGLLFEETPLAVALSELLRRTQDKWLRPAGKERWEINEHPHHKHRRDDYVEHLRGLDIIDAIPPKADSYDGVLLLSAVAATFQRRLDYFSELVAKGMTAKTVYLVASSRPLVPGIEDRWIRRLGPAATELQLHEAMFEDQVKAGKLPSGAWSLLSVDCPSVRTENGGMRRANTHDQLVSWLALKPAHGRILCFSSQPYVRYQGAILESLIDPSAFQVDCCGPAVKDNEKVGVMLDSLARYLYVKYPHAMRWVEAQK